MRELSFSSLLLAATSVRPLSARAERYEVGMLNRGEAGGLVYEPPPRIRPGDTVRFLATGISHDAASMPNMPPPDARAFEGQINQEIEVAFDVAGRYGIRRIPHHGMGMAMLVQVGDGAPDAIPLPADLPQGVRQRLEAILQRHEAV